MPGNHYITLSLLCIDTTAVICNRDRDADHTQVTRLYLVRKGYQSRLISSLDGLRISRILWRIHVRTNSTRNSFLI